MSGGKKTTSPSGRLKKIIKEQAELLEFYEAALFSLPNPVFIKDKDLRFCFFNKSYQEFFGLSPEQYVGLEVRDLPYLTEEERMRYHAEDKNALENSSVIHYETKYPQGDDERESIYWSKGFVTQSGIKGIIGEIVDISDEKQLEKDIKEAMEQAKIGNEAKSNFLSNISHDIRTPLNAIIGFSGLARKYENDPQKMLEYITKIQEAGNHLRSLINDVLDMSQIEKGKVSLELAAHDVQELAVGVQTLVAENASAKNLELVVDTQKITHKMVICDALRINRILINIIGNSIKFTNPGGRIALTVSENHFRKDADGRHAEYIFTIEDNGLGMDEEFIPKIFNAFERERTSTISGIQGAGLGMAIVKSLVDMMGGDIQVRSKKGVGSTFIIRLPFKIVDEEAPDGQEASALPAEEANIADLVHTVLLVEDNDFNAEIATEILEDYEIAVDWAENGKKAVDMLMQKGPDFYDLVLMDIQMPVMNGFEATKTIRSMHSGAYASLPIVAISANAFTEEVEKAYEAGMDAYAKKPLDMDELFTAIRQAMHQ